MRVRYFFTGKPGVGKTLLADKLATKIPSVKITLDSLVSALLDDPFSPEYAKYSELLNSGHEISQDIILQEIDKRVNGEESAFKGYILDGIPLLTSDASITKVKEILQSGQDQYINVMVHLAIEDEALIRRRAGQWIDPKNNQVYSGDQVKYSRRRISEGFVEGLDEEAQKEELYFQKKLQKELEDDQQEEEEAVEDNIENKEEENDIFRIRKTWPILGEDILNRLIKKPEDDPARVVEELKDYALKEKVLKEIREEYFDRGYVIDVDGSDHPESILRNLLMRIDLLGLGIYRAPELKILAQPEGGFRALAEADIIKYWQTAQLEEGEIKREVSKWGKYCPIHFYHSQLLSVGSVEECVAYKGYIYFFCNQDYRKQFCLNPDKYYNNSKSIKNLRISILGGPHSGKTKQAKLLATRYNLVYLNAEDILLALDQAPNQAELKDTRPSYSSIADTLKSGRELKGEQIVKLFQEELEKNEGNNGWILDGFPQTMDQVMALSAVGLMPKHVCFLKNDINDVNIRSRGEAFKCSSKTGKKVDAPQLRATALSGKSPVKVSNWMPELEIAMYPNFDNMFNGYKEELAQITAKFNEDQGTVLEVLAEYSWATIFSTILNMIDPLIPKAVPLLPKDVAELPEEIDYGLTKDYCPVTIRDSKVLLKCSKNYVAKYLSSVYLFSSDEARTSFLVEPFNYVTDIKIPPLRLVFLGPTGSGKTTYIKQFNSFGAIHVNFSQYIIEFANKQSKASKEVIMRMINDGIVSPAVTIEVLGSLYRNEPYASKGFILEGFPQSRVDVETMMKNQFLVDAFVDLKVPAENCARRLYSQNYKDTEEGSASEERIMSELANKVELEISQINEVVAAIEGSELAQLIEINANRFIRPIVSEIKRKLSSFTENRSNLLLNPMKISKAKAEMMLKFGIKEYSPCGKLCPVTIRKSGIVSSSAEGTKPVIFRDRIYYLKDAKNLQEFINRPNSYTFDSKMPPLVCPNMAIIGAPKSGKSLLARKLAAEQELVYLTVPYIITVILNGNDTGSLYEKLKACLDSGKVVPDSLLTDAVRTVTARVQNMTKGWILDGYPNTLEQARLLEEAGVTPHIIGHISISEKLSLERTEADYLKYLEDALKKLNAPGIAVERYHAYYENTMPVSLFYSQKYANVLELDGSASIWLIKERIKEEMSSSLKSRQSYLEGKSNHNAVSVYNVGLSLAMVQANMGKYLDYCPVCFVDDHELKKGESSLRYTAEYDNQFYRMIGQKELNLFLKSPKKYVDGPSLPADLPIRRHLEDIKEVYKTLKIELNGYCPVSLKEGKPGFESILLGKMEYVAEHAGLVYAMESNEKLLQFMRAPWKYTNQVLPKKLPPPSNPIAIQGLPIIGYLEQSVATSLVEALSSLSHVKPKYPFKSLKGSAIEYLALYLKSSNPKSSEWLRTKFQTKLDNFQQDCNLIKSLASDFHACNDTFTDVADRPPYLDSNLGILEKLKNRT